MDNKNIKQDSLRVDINNSILQETMFNALTKGAQFGIPWNSKVYEYLFESDINQEELEKLLNPTLQFYKNCSSTTIIYSAPILDKKN